MTDVDREHQRILSAFGWDLWRSNHAGIGNECTHWIYAALLEARALNHDRGLGIAQNGQRYTWGRLIEPAQALAGDIVQFRNYLNRFLFWFRDEGRWLFQDFLRGPMHTAMVAITQSNIFEGQHLLLESHLHQPGVPRMTIRDNRVHYANFAVALTSAQLLRVRGTRTWPASVDTTNQFDLARNVVWLTLRKDYPFPIHSADLAFERIMHGSASHIDSNITFPFCLSTTGEIRFYRPQQSRERLAMNSAQFQAEKERVIAMMIRGGRQATGRSLVIRSTSTAATTNRRDSAPTFSTGVSMLRSPIDARSGS